MRLGWLPQARGSDFAVPTFCESQQIELLQIKFGSGCHRFHGETGGASAHGGNDRCRLPRTCQSRRKLSQARSS